VEELIPGDRPALVDSTTDRLDLVLQLDHRRYVTRQLTRLRKLRLDANGLNAH